MAMRRVLLRPIGSLVSPALRPNNSVLSSLGTGFQQHRFLATETGTRKMRSSSTSPAKKLSGSESAKRSSSASPKRKSAKRAGSKKSPAKRAQDAEKKAAARERKRESRERRLAEEQDKKERRAESKAERRERKLAKKEEQKEKRAARREEKRERRTAKKEEEKIKARNRRAKDKERAFGRKREPGSPPMPRNALSLFMKAQMPKTPGDNMPQKMKAVAAVWKQLPADQKKPYEDAASADKERYAKEFAAWREENPARPKRPMTPYMYFAQEQRKTVAEANPTLTGLKGSQQIAKLMGTQWKALSVSQKQPYNTKAEADHHRYEREKAAWESKMQASA
jgi:hypothetical protein